MPLRPLRIVPVVASALLAACGTAPAPKETGMKTSPAPTMKKQPFGQTASGQAVDLYTLSNSKGMEVGIINLGGIVTSIKVPDRNGAVADVALGFETLDGYLKEHPYFGAIVGRYGNRIAKGTFSLNGTKYTLAKNNGDNALHGGMKGFDKAIWTARDVSGSGGPSLELKYLSKDGEEGYPGNLDVTVTYTLTDNNELKIDYLATTDKDTVLNLTNHSYFNLAGQGNGDVLNHVIQINADRFTPVDKGLIPTGELRKVEGTPFDFRQPHAIGERINANEEQVKRGLGYDHNFVLNSGGGSMAQAVRVEEPTTGRVMEVSTTEPGVQFYTGNFLDGSLTGKGGKGYQKRYGFCLETQHFPDSPNQASFPSTVLKPGAKYQSSTVYRFSTK